MRTLKRFIFEKEMTVVGMLFEEEFDVTEYLGVLLD